MILKQITSTIVTIIVFFVILFVYTKLAGPIPFSVTSVSTTKSTTFDVTGVGKATVTPDRSQVSAGVSVSGNSAQDVKNQINATINKVSQSLAQLGINASDIKTANYDINPTYNWSNGSQQITGYSGNTTLTITVQDMSKLNSVIDSVTNAGATNVNQNGFSVADQTAAENDAREKAIADAKKKAQEIARIAGFSLGKIVNYSESSGDVQPRPILDMAAGKGAEPPTQIQPGSQDITISVTLSFDIQ